MYLPDKAKHEIYGLTPLPPTSLGLREASGSPGTPRRGGALAGGTTPVGVLPPAERPFSSAVGPRPHLKMHPNYLKCRKMPQSVQKYSKAVKRYRKI